MTVRDDVWATIGLMIEDPAADAVIVSRLIARGYEPLKAELLCALVPLGLARPVIRRIAVESPIRLPRLVCVQHPVNKRMFKVMLNRLSEFEEAQRIGEETFETGLLSSKELEEAASRSVEMTLVNEALNAGARLGNAVMAPPILLRLAEVAGFEEWYRQVQDKRGPLFQNLFQWVSTIWERRSESNR